MCSSRYHIFSEKMLTTKKVALDDSTEIEIFSFSQWKLFRHFIAQKPFKPQKVVKWTSTEWLLMKCFLRPPTLFPYLTKFNITECQLGIIIFPEASLEWKLGGKFLKPMYCIEHKPYFHIFGVDILSWFPWIKIYSHAHYVCMKVKKV